MPWGKITDEPSPGLWSLYLNIHKACCEHAALAYLLRAWTISIYTVCRYRVYQLLSASAFPDVSEVCTPVVVFCVVPVWEDSEHRREYRKQCTNMPILKLSTLADEKLCCMMRGLLMGVDHHSAELSAVSVWRSFSRVGTIRELGGVVPPPNFGAYQGWILCYNDEATELDPCFILKFKVLGLQR